jgi:quercetin dioxygenase-like cupin family protein
MLTAAPLAACAQTKKITAEKGRAFKAAAGEGRIHGHLRLKGVNENILDLKVSGKDINGRLAIFEQTSLSPKRGTPLHVHHKQDEVFYVLEGEYAFKVSEESFNLKRGDSIFLPMKIPHAWTQVSDKGKIDGDFATAGKLEDFL